MWRRAGLTAFAVLLGFAQQGQSSLITFRTLTGNIGVSSDGFGSLTQSGIISAFVPAGAVVREAYLYSGTNTISGATHTAGGTLNGTAVSYGAPVINTSATYLASSRADVTSIVKPIIDGGAGGTYNFNLTESNTSQDGEALVVIYDLASLPVATVGVLDGFASVDGDTATINFVNPLDPGAAGFFAEMRLGINYSCCSQASTVTVNGTLITANAGNYDDGASEANGSLITVGGDDDPFSPFLPSYGEDHERYNLVPRINLGDSQISVRTANGTRDDNVFLAVFYVSGEGLVSSDPVPEPATYTLIAVGLIGAGLMRRVKAGRASS